jgi:polar amino acid transport system permease protein
MILIGAFQFDGHYFWQHLLHPQGFFLRAVETTVYLAVAGQVLGTLIGLPLAIARRSTNRLLVALAWFYSWFWRGTPLLVQLLIIYTGLAEAGVYHWRELHFGLFSLPGEQQAAIVTLALAEAAYMGEIFRAAIGSIDRGQWEAAKTVGMAPWPTMRLVILPQAARVVVPPLGNEFITMLKQTSLLSVIGVTELFRTSSDINSADFKTFEIFFVAAIWYLLLTSVWSLIQNRIEARLARSDRAVVATPEKTSVGRLTGFGR